MLDAVFQILQFRISTPQPYGLFHIVGLVLIILMAYFMCLKQRNINEHIERRWLCLFSIVLIVFECYKQLIFSYNLGGEWHYRWYAFPFQFCSIPLYALPLVTFLKEGRLRQALFNFTASYTMLAGLMVLLYPKHVFVEMAGINFHTISHHGIMFIMGAWLWASGRAKLNKRSIVDAFAVFCFFLVIAVALNVTVVQFLTPGTTFNMFFISPYFETTIPVLSFIQQEAPYFMFLIAYVLGFSALSLSFSYISATLLKPRNTR